MQYNRENGFTLVEVLISMFVFAVGVLAVIDMQLMSAKTNLHSRGITEAVVVAQNAVERLVVLPKADPRLNPGGLNLDGNDKNYPEFSNTSGYDVSWTVRDDFPFKSNKTIQVVVTWRDRTVDVKQSFAINSTKD